MSYPKLTGKAIEFAFPDAQPLTDYGVGETDGVYSLDWDAAATGQTKPTPAEIQAIIDSREFQQWQTIQLDPVLAEKDREKQRLDAEPLFDALSVWLAKRLNVIHKRIGLPLVDTATVKAEIRAEIDAGVVSP